MGWVVSKQSAFIAQLVAVYEVVQSVLKDLQWWSINDLLWQHIPAIHNSLAEEAHSALFQWSVFVQFVIMSSELYSISSDEELPVDYVFNVSQYFICFY